MDPQISIMGLKMLTFNSYKLFMAISAAAAMAICYMALIKEKLTVKQAVALTLTIGAGFFLGARLLHYMLNRELYIEKAFKITDISATNFALYGGILGSALLGGLAVIIMRLRLLKIADILVPAICVGIGTMKIGCLFNGCCYGKETELPWGIRFPMGSPAYSYHFKDKAANFTILNIPLESHAVHPTQIYELLAAAAIMLLAVYLNKKSLKDGIVFIACSLAFTIFRTINHGLREFNSAQANYLMWQPRLYLVIMAILSGMLLWIFFSDGIGTKKRA
ncbi:hypothetical protein EAL2_c06900 [Peptoclostridium acidaminophilum DSM 3953]|uniref:Phosphatidylglycerol--prolipoprotein diacylglyceryl transferase n=2 Tax=Peptoclostridium acidaminophilum TaxID=1731 RepID=W8U4W4_PEPAC|nr:prolipoprotein diacylglyceryl transferase family protein [Peptoclostridium acidaminophilum]AAN86539.1 unknown [Peptoclostridium acidaminophilum]AHM55991.1 hypothetical protein EAL2_c06900 [Peptoclostridium acidaminophilum DSM 3953]